MCCESDYIWACINRSCTQAKTTMGNQGNAWPVTYKLQSESCALRVVIIASTGMGGIYSSQLSWSNVIMAHRSLHSWQGGTFLYLEHVTAERKPWLKSFQVLINPFWKLLFCSLTTDVSCHVTDAGFTIETEEYFFVDVQSFPLWDTLMWPIVVRAHVMGVAVKWGHYQVLIVRDIYWYVCRMWMINKCFSVGWGDQNVHRASHVPSTQLITSWY